MVSGAGRERKCQRVSECQYVDTQQAWADIQYYPKYIIYNIDH